MTRCWLGSRWNWVPPLQGHGESELQSDVRARQLHVPAAVPYFVLPISDDETALFRSIGTGMRWKRPRLRMLLLTVQTQGIVGIVVTAVVAGGCGGLAGSSG